MTKIIAGSSSAKLAYDLSQCLEAEYLEALINRFADGELRVEIPELISGEDIIIVQSTYKPANDHLMELLMLTDAAKRSGASKITTLIPYFGYSRHDRTSYDGGSISARLVANLLETSGADHVITLDLHSGQAENFFKIGVQNVDPTSLFFEYIEQTSNLVIVSPDIGSVKRAQRMSEKLNADLVIINKSRTEHNRCRIDNIIGDFAGKHCIIVDDIADTGETLCKAAEALKDKGALQVEAIVTHSVLSDGAIERLEKAPIDRIITSNSIPHKSLSSKFVIVDITGVISKAIQSR